jgi:hypothetical protein
VLLHKNLGENVVVRETCNSFHAQYEVHTFVITSKFRRKCGVINSYRENKLTYYKEIIKPNLLIFLV